MPKLKFDPEKLAEEYKLTDMQRKFAEFYVYVTNLNGKLAVELAGYKVDKDQYESYPENIKEKYKQRELNTIARNLLNNPKIIKYIDALRSNLESHLIVDKLWVINGLKDLAMNGGENAKIRALEMLGKYVGIFSDAIKLDIDSDPAEMAKKAFEKRKQLENTVEFKKQENE